MPAQVHQLSRSPGGVPKRAVERVHIGAMGLEGDWQRNRVHHGGPDRAVCLFPLELITRLRDEGHPIVPGATGENITTVGLDWAHMVPGARLRIGGEVELEIVSYTVPCKTIGAAFVDADFTRISQKVHPGSSRVYARVLRDGEVAVGDPITVHTAG
jgi:MOSC domain-containing protein YiiM